MVWIQIRTDQIRVRMLTLIWLRTIYKGYQQTTKVTASKERVTGFLYGIDFSFFNNLSFSYNSQ